MIAAVRAPSRSRPEGVIGIVDEVIGTRDGEPIGLLVVDGWFGARRCSSL